MAQVVKNLKSIGRISGLGYLVNTVMVMVIPSKK